MKELIRHAESEHVINFRYKLVPIARVLFAVLFFTMPGISGFSQGFTSPNSWHHIIHDARVAALGQSTAALNNGTPYHANPAIISEHGVLSASSFLISANPFLTTFAEPELYSPAIGYSAGKFTYSAMMDYTTFTIPVIPFSTNEKEPYSNMGLRFQVGYQLSEYFSLGVGILYDSYKSPTTTQGNLTYGGDATAWGINAGMYYQNEFESDNFVIRPHSGLSLNNLSKGFDFESTGMNEKNLPGQIRFGLGLDISSKQTWQNHSLFGGGIYTGFSKYLARKEIEDQTVTYPSGFKALFTTWNSFESFNGIEMEEITLSDQISKSIGFELHFLETVYVRYGVTGGADWWIRPQHGLGAEIDLYYVSLAVTHLNSHSSQQWLPQYNITNIQTTLRFPLDGKPRDTLLGRLLKW